jgi:tetratricopeptide (TPR) repeat protein
MADEITSDDEELPTVQELEEELREDPDNPDLKSDLAVALLEEHLNGEGSELNLERLKEILPTLPPDQLLFQRTYVAWVAGSDEEALEKLAECALQFTRDNEEPSTCDELFWDWLWPFSDDPPRGFFKRLAQVFGQNWPDSAAALTLQGLAESDASVCLDYLIRALGKDPDFWLPAWQCAVAYTDLDNWRAARGYFQRALKSESAACLSRIHFQFGWCLGRIKEYEQEAAAYRTCLELEPDYPNARNNLGWSLMKAGKTEEAVPVFRDALQRGNDGKYPLRNLARALRKLGRYSEAIEVLRQDIHGGALTKSAQKQIAELQALLDKQAEGESAPPDEGADESEEGEVAATAGGSEAAPRAESASSGGDQAEPESRAARGKAKPQPLRKSEPIRREQTFEALLEEMILLEKRAFGRNVRMYESPEGLYGRQLAIPNMGRIDLLVEDLDSHDLIVIELKRDKSTDEVVGQTCRYIGWAREKLAKPDQKVLGIICVHETPEPLRLAVSTLQDISLFEYALTFARVPSAGVD